MVPEPPEPGSGDDDVVLERPNAVLDALVARDAALAGRVAEPAPAVKSSPAQEWGAALLLMIVISLLCFAFVSFFRG